MDLTVVNVYKLALPVFVGITLLFAPAEYFLPLPDILQPLIGNGLLMGILLSLLFENVHVGRKKVV